MACPGISALILILRMLFMPFLKSMRETFTILTTFQYSFRPGHSCATTLLEIFKNTLKAVDNCEDITLILFDYSKELDKIDHRLYNPFYIIQGEN